METFSQSMRCFLDAKEDYFKNIDQHEKIILPKKKL